MTKKQFLEKSRNIFGYKYNYPFLNEKLTLKDYVDIEYQGKIYKQNVNKHLTGSCPEKITPNKTTEEFIKQSKEIWGDKFDYSLTFYVNSKTKIKLIEKETGKQIDQFPNNHLYGHKVNSMTKDDFIKQSEIISDSIYDYNKCDFKNKTTKVKLICQLHGEFEVLPYLHLNGQLCSECDENLMSKNVIKFLNKYNLNHYRQQKFGELFFDFYIPSIRTCIEIIGKQHFQPMNSQIYDKIKILEKIKEDYCEDNFISLFKIRYDEINSIYEILWRNLKSHINPKVISFAK